MYINTVQMLVSFGDPKLVIMEGKTWKLNKQKHLSTLKCCMAYLTRNFGI